MPRLPNLLLHTARSLHPDLPLLLRACRDLRSAQNELRWLRQHLLATVSNSARQQQHARELIFRIRWTEPISRLSNYFRRHSQRLLRPRRISREEGVLRRWCRERSRGMPLQYILGSQPFGAVDVLCRRGVLIPRPETEAYTIRIARLILNLLDDQSGNTSTTIPPGASENLPITRLRILDLCTGTGCIPLLLHAILSAKVSYLEIMGVDISPAAIALAKENLHYNIAEGHLPLVAQSQIQFVQADIFDDISKAIPDGNWDIVISNPPYISPKGFNKNTSRSVRNYEPKIALVPSPSLSTSHAATGLPGDDETKATSDTTIGDSFYPQILKIASQVKARMVLMEVSDLAQAKRVASQGIRSGYWQYQCEIWRDWPDEAEVGVEVGEPGREGGKKEGEEGEEEAVEEEEEEEDQEEAGKQKSKTHISGIPVRILGNGNGRSVFLSSV